MRAWIRQHRGHYKSSLKLVDSLPTPPVPGPDSSDIIVHVSYVALEFSIAYFMDFFPSLQILPPLIPELCVSGTVASAGGKAPEGLRQPGTQVLAMTDPMSMVFCGAGALKEYMRLPEAYVVPLPKLNTHVDEHSADGHPTLSLAQGAGLISNGSTAQATVRAAKVCSGQRVLINGANCVGSHALYTNSPTYLRPDGPFVSVGAFGLGDSILTQVAQWFMNTWRPTWLGGIPRPYIFFSNTPKIHEVLSLVEMANQGRLKVILDSEFDVEDLIPAYERVMSKRARGKVLIRMHSGE
nr:uncharacterized protein CTRU02_15606 [Colletotrichum truncatum]KAF6780854.1 hypothetical protein CTRU02_15606 [Colletotrichum truncatum]